MTQTQTTQVAEEAKVEVRPPAVLLLGEPGNGKTFSLATLALHPFIERLVYIFTDPGGEESLIDAFEYYDIPMDKLHWRYVPPASEGWDSLNELVEKVQAFNYEGLAGLKSGIDKSGHRQMFDLLGALSNFKCQRTGAELGPVDKWPSNYAVAFDSLTGLNKIARDCTVGSKPSLHQGEWGIAMAVEENLIRKFVAGINCPRVMIGHLDKTQDILTGGLAFSVSLLGNKLAPQIPHLFSDVVYAYREGPKFLWTTTDDRISLKSRNLPVASKQIPSFKPIIDKWRKRVELTQVTETETVVESLDGSEGLAS